MDRIRRVSRVMRYACLIAAVLFGIGVAAALALLGLRTPLTVLDGPVIAAPTLGDRAVTVALVALPLLLGLGVLVLCARLFAAFEHGVVLVPENGRRLSAIGATVIVATIAKGMTSSALGAYLSWRAGDGELAITLSSGALSGIGAGLLLLVVGWVLGEAAELAREHAAIV